MKSYSSPNNPIKTQIAIKSNSAGVSGNNAGSKKYINLFFKDFTSLKAYLTHRFWEANQITDQV